MIKMVCPICSKSLVCNESAKEEKELKAEFSKHFSTHYNTWKNRVKSPK